MDAMNARDDFVGKVRFEFMQFLISQRMNGNNMFVPFVSDRKYTALTVFFFRKFFFYPETDW